jgi:hypothetical protein
MNRRVVQLRRMAAIFALLKVRIANAYPIIPELPASRKQLEAGGTLIQRKF